jgi:hypothetical protein
VDRRLTASPFIAEKKAKWKGFAFHGFEAFSRIRSPPASRVCGNLRHRSVGALLAIPPSMALNVVIGALVGGVLNVAGFAIVQTIRRKPIAWKDATASFVGGAIGGALCGATFGASLLAGGGAGAVTFMSANGAASWGAERVTSNLLEHRPVTEGVGHDMLTGAIEAPIFYGVTKAIGPTRSGGGVARSFGARVGAFLSRRPEVGRAVRNAASTFVVDLAESATCYSLPEGRGDDEPAPTPGLTGALVASAR